MYVGEYVEGYCSVSGQRISPTSIGKESKEQGYPREWRKDSAAAKYAWWATMQ
jgi:hypothetical protein